MSEKPKQYDITFLVESNLQKPTNKKILQTPTAKDWKGKQKTSASESKS